MVGMFNKLERNL